MKSALSLSLISCVLLAACVADEHQDIKQWMQEASQGIKGHIPPLPEIKPFPIVSYEAADLLDPFNPLKLVPENTASGDGLHPDLERSKEVLEAYPLESLKMVGVIRERDRISALVRADDGVHTVNVGNYMGQNFGMIQRITDTEIQLKEMLQEPDKSWTERTTALQLQEQESK